MVSKPTFDLERQIQPIDTAFCNGYRRTRSANHNNSPPKSKTVNSGSRQSLDSLLAL